MTLQLVAGPQQTRQLYDEIDDPKLMLTVSHPDMDTAR